MTHLFKEKDMQTQDMNKVSAHVHIIIGPVVPRIHLVVIALVTEGITGLDTCSCNTTFPVDPWSAE